MTSFKFGSLSAKDRAAGRFLTQVHRAFAEAAVRQKNKLGLTQRSLATAMEVDKSAISRILSGQGNPTTRTIGELAWAMGLRPTIILEPLSELAHNNNNKSSRFVNFNTEVNSQTSGHNSTKAASPSANRATTRIDEEKTLEIAGW